MPLSAIPAMADDVSEEKITLTAADFNFTPIVSTPYNDTAQGFGTITLKAPYSGLTGSAEGGRYTAFYTGTGGTNYAKSTTAPKNAGSYTVTVEVTGGTVFNAATSENPITLGSFTITPLNLSGFSVTATFPTVTYSGSSQTPTPTDIRFNAIPAVFGTDYTLGNWQGNTDAGTDTASVDITGAGNFTGTATVKFSIDPKPLTLVADDKMIVVGDPEPAYTYTVIGLADGDTESDVITTPPTLDLDDGTLTLPFDSSSDGMYWITITGGACVSNYTIDGYIDGTLTVSSAGGSGDPGGGSPGGGDPGTTPPLTPPPGGDEGKTTDLDGGSKVDTPPGQDPEDNGDGSTTLPGGGTITTPDNEEGKGGTTITVPPGTVISEDGKISFPQGSGGGSVTLDNGLTFNINEGAILILDELAPLGYFVFMENPFGDVGADDWYYDAVMFAYAHGIMNGTSVDSMVFSPDDTTTRGMIVTLLYYLAGSLDVSGFDNPFDDVAAGEWYTNAVIWANHNGIVTGYGNGNYGPEDSITREQLVAILNNYTVFAGIELPEIRRSPVFVDDADIADYAREAIDRFFAAGIIDGKPGNIFDPQGNTTRAETAAMFQNFLEAAE